MKCFRLLGSYQIRMAKSYILEHLRPSNIDNEQMEFIVELCNEHEDLVRARFHYRHSKQKQYMATLQFKEKKQQSIQGWYCICTSGAREVSMRSHVIALLWHLGVERAVIKTSVHLLAAVKLLDSVDDSMKFSDDGTDSDTDTDNQPFLAFSSTTNKNDGSDEDSDW